MNERIKELVKQAEIKFEPYSQHQGVDTAVIIPTDLEKFAELIVQECFTKLTPYLDDQFIDDIELELKEHFGVEE